MDLQFKTFPFEIKGGSADGSTFEGLVSAFYNIDSYGEIVDDGAFDQDLPEFMDNGFIGGLNHDWDNPIGKPQPGTKKVANGLHLVANVIDTAHGMDVRKMLKAGVVKKLSIGYKTMGDMVLNDADECMAYWESKGYKPNAQDMARCKMGARVLTRIKLFEGSPVTVPANDLAMITAVKAARDAATAALKEAKPEEDPSNEVVPKKLPDLDALEAREAKAFQGAIETLNRLKKNWEPLLIPAEEATNEARHNERLEKIRSIECRADAEEILRNAGFSRSESAALVSSVKSLLRNAGADDADTDAKDAGEDAPPNAEEPPADADAPTAEPNAETSETLAEWEDGKSAEAEEAKHVDTLSDLIAQWEKEPTPELEAKLAAKREAARRIAQRQLAQDAAIARILADNAKR